MVRVMCGIQLKDRKISMDLIFMLGLSEAIDQLAMANSVHWNSHVLWREDGHVQSMCMYYVQYMFMCYAKYMFICFD